MKRSAVVHSLKIATLVGVLLLGGIASAQTAGDVETPSPRPSFRSAVDLVSVAAVVRDKRGQVVRNLSREDFEVFDNGVRRPIVEFSSGENGPISLAVLVDVSGSMAVASHLDAARQTLDLLLRRLREGQDEVALFSFDRGLNEHQSFTTNPAAIRNALAGLRPFGITSLYDAVAETARRVETRDYKRRAILVLTDGVDTASRLSPGEVSAIASATDVPVYVMAVLSRIDHDAALEADTQATPTGQLTNLASWTGGHAYVLSAPAHAVVATENVLSELRHQYVFAFEAAGPAGWRPLDVRLRKRELSVRARSGYFASQRAAGE
jgi:Ca-activated chloride channel family protein